MTPVLRDAWRLAVGTLTAVPVRPPVTVDRRRAGLAMVLAPLAVVPLGLLVAAIGYVAGARSGLTPLTAALLAIGALVLGNRAFHVDGLADTVDGLAASYDRERALAVMKTGTSGPAGVVAIVLVIGLQASGLAGVLSGPDPVARALLAGLLVCGSRAALALCCARGVPSARPGGLGDTYTGTVPVLAAAAIWGGLALALPWLVPSVEIDWWRGPLAVALAAAVTIIVIARAIRRLGGVTGDVFGAAVELALATLLVALS
ncbi:MAG: adenosylcobinamide-GDP ribazoletransferase [Nocardioides sp.]